jgi:hypothetical protein
MQNMLSVNRDGIYGKGMCEEGPQASRNRPMLSYSNPPFNFFESYCAQLT